MQKEETKRVLDIVITHYNEPFELVKTALDMLINQQCVDFDKFRVTMVHDGSEAFEETLTIKFPFIFREIIIEHGGVSAARNAGMDIANAEWVTFCDCDDCYSSIFSLCRLISMLENETQFDVMWNKFYISKEDLSVPMIQSEYELVWIHNKYFRLDYLRKNNIRFNTDISYSEDGAFVFQAYLYIGKDRWGTLETADPLYTWRVRKDSISHSDGKEIWKAQEVLKRNIYVSGIFKDLHRDATRIMMARTVTDAYKWLTAEDWSQYETEKEEFLLKLRAFYKENFEYFNLVTDVEWDYVLTASKTSRTSKFEKFLRILKESALE